MRSEVFKKELVISAERYSLFGIGSVVRLGFDWNACSARLW